MVQWGNAKQRVSSVCRATVRVGFVVDPMVTSCAPHNIVQIRATQNARIVLSLPLGSRWSQQRLPVVPQAPLVGLSPTRSGVLPINDVGEVYIISVPFYPYCCLCVHVLDKVVRSHSKYFLLCG